MARRKSRTPKREAKQQRSKDTIEVILSAAGLVIDKHGYQAATTDRVAEKAGVSVGTIYQYFNNKDEIFARFLAREEANVMDTMRSVATFNGQSDRLRLSTYIRAGAPEYLTPKVFDELSKVESLEESISHLSSSVIELTASFIQSLRPDLSNETAQTYAVLLVTTAQGLRAASETGADEVLLGSFIEMWEKFLLGG